MAFSTRAQTAAMAGCIASTLLSGINFSASQLTLPILYRLPAESSTNIFEELFYRGGWVIVPLTIFSTLSAATAAYMDPVKRTGFAIAAIFSFASLPWTAIIMRPHIQTLIKLSHEEQYRKEYTQQNTVSLLRKWTWMNNVRSTLALIGGVVGLATLCGRL